MIERASMVIDVAFEHEAQTHTACYFIEHNLIHAKIGDRLLAVPMLGPSASQLVRALLRDYVLGQPRVYRAPAQYRDISGSDSFPSEELALPH